MNHGNGWYRKGDNMIIRLLDLFFNINDWIIFFYQSIGAILITLSYKRTTDEFDYFELVSWLVILFMWWDVAFLLYKNPVKKFDSKINDD